MLESHKSIVKHRKSEPGLGMVKARIPSAVPQVHEDNDVPTIGLLV